MTALSFFCPCVPPETTHHHKKIARIGKFTRLVDKPELVKARRDLEAVLLPHRPTPAAPIHGPVRLDIEFTWPWRASETKRNRALGRMVRSSMPDCSNLAKTLEDRLAFLLFIGNDAAVADLRVRKWWGDTPGIAVAITALDLRGRELDGDTTTREALEPRAVPRQRLQRCPVAAFEFHIPGEVCPHCGPSQHGLFAEAQPS